MFSGLLLTCPRVEWLGHTITAQLSEECQTLFQGGFGFSPSRRRGAGVPVSPRPHRPSSVCFVPAVVRGLGLYFPGDRRCRAASYVPLGCCVSSLEKCLLGSLARFWLGCFFSCWVAGVISVFQILAPFWYVICKYFFAFYGSLFHFFGGCPLHTEDFSIWIKSNLPIFL